MQRWHGRSANGFTELDDTVVPTGSTRGYRVTWELGSDRIRTIVYDRGNRYKNTHKIEPSGFSFTSQVDDPVGSPPPPVESTTTAAC